MLRYFYISLVFFVEATTVKKYLLTIMFLILCGNIADAIIVEARVFPIAHGKKLIILSDEHYTSPANREQLLAFIEILKRREAESNRRLHILCEHSMPEILCEHSMPETPELIPASTMMRGLVAMVKRQELQKTTVEDIENRHIKIISHYTLDQDIRFTEDCCPHSYVTPDGKEWIIRDFTFENLIEEHDNIARKLKTIYDFYNNNCDLTYYCPQDIYEFFEDHDQGYNELRYVLQENHINLKDTLYKVARQMDKKDQHNLHRIIIHYLSPLFDMNASLRIVALQRDNTYDDIVFIGGSAHSLSINSCLATHGHTIFGIGTTDIDVTLKLPDSSLYPSERDLITAEDRAVEEYHAKLASFALKPEALSQALLKNPRFWPYNSYFFRASCASVIILLTAVAYSCWS